MHHGGFENTELRILGAWLKSRVHLSYPNIYFTPKAQYLVTDSKDKNNSPFS